jgi:hypothetical protein
MGKIRTLSSDADYREFREFYLSCEETVPVRVFNKISRKRFPTFFMEHRKKEIEISQDPDTGVFVVDRQTARGFVRNPTQEMYILEESRTYENGETVPNYPEGITLEMWSASETIHRGETALETFIRCLIEEMGVKPGRIKPGNFKIPGREPPAFGNFRKSGVYAAVNVRQKVFWFSAETHEFSPSFKFSNKRDNGVRLNRVWIDENTGQRILAPGSDLTAF